MAFQVPFVGRGAELSLLRSLRNRAREGKGTTLFLRGPGGVGKSRLAGVIAQEAASKEWTVLEGRAFPVGTGVPYAVFADALTSLVQELDPETLKVLTRGTEDELAFLIPTLGPPRREELQSAGMTPAEIKVRLFWNFAQFLARLGRRNPVLLVLEDLQWADESSLELLHFAARQLDDAPVFLLCVYNDEETDGAGELLSTEQSLTSVGAAEVHDLSPLGPDDTLELLKHTFEAPAKVAEPFSRALYDWTRGNPFFLVEILKDLVDAGRLRKEGEVWVGWETRDLELPGTVRETLEARLSRLSEPAKRVARIAAVMGARARHDVLSSVSELEDDDLLAALDELRQEHVLTEGEGEEAILYEFSHPLLRETIYSALGRARARRMHGVVGETLERVYGDGATDRADELAFHFNRASEADLAPRAVKYLTLAGRQALARHANREAAGYLRAALERAKEEEAPLQELGAERLLADLARACQRVGEFEEAIGLWRRARDRERELGGEPGELAALQRRLGLAHYWAGHRPRALEEYREGLELAREADDPALEARLRLAQGVCLQEVGRPEEAGETLEKALDRAEADGRPALLARVHRALLTLHTWSGPPEAAREHGETAAELARDAEAPDLLWSVHWSRAVFEGLSGNGTACQGELELCQEMADELQSPIRQLWTSEVAIELLSATGDWDEALAMGETNISLARSLGQTTLLPRLLVSTALVYVGRGENERAREYVDEAWELSGAGGEEDRAANIHAVVPAHTGRAAYLRSIGEYREAIRVGEAGLAIAEKVGYLVWGIHRLLPVIAEAYLELRDLEGARKTGDRLRRYSERMGHKLGLAWADACDALVAWLDGEPERAIGLIRTAAEELEAIPFVHDAARVRRQLAGRLADAGRRDEAISELRRVHDIFDRLGAKPELAKTRDQFRELDARPPVRIEGGGAGALTGRELEVARLVAERKSNKAIGKELEISPRTVSTHLSNIYRKLDVSSRGELTDRVREGVWPRE